MVKSSSRLILRAPTDLEICAGTFASMEAEVIELQSRFGVDPNLVDYAWMPESHYDDEALPCNLSTFACSIGNNVYARTLASTHELVHASRPSLPAVLEEGLATLLSVPRTNDVGEMATRDELLTALELGTWEQASDERGVYERSAHFVSFLLAAWGHDKFADFERRVRGASSNREQPLAKWEADFEDIYGEPFSAVWQEYADYPDCGLAQYHLPLTACTMVADGALSASLRPAFMTDTEDAEFSDSLACADAHVFGPRQLLDGATVRAANFAVEVDNWIGGSVHVTLTGAASERSRLLLTNCGDCWDGSASMLTGSSPSELLNIQSGPYALILFAEIDAHGELGVRLRY